LKAKRFERVDAFCLTPMAFPPFAQAAFTKKVDRKYKSKENYG